MAAITRYFTQPTASNSLKLDPYCQQEQCSSGSIVFGTCTCTWETTRVISAVAELLVNGYMLHFRHSTEHIQFRVLVRL